MQPLSLARRILLPCCLAGLAVAQNVDTTTTQAEPWLPLQPGTRWVYHVQRQTGRSKHESTCTVTVDGQGALASGERVFLLRLDASGEPAPRFQCWSLAADGVRQHLGDARRRGDLDHDAAPMHWLRIGDTGRSHGIEQQWQWTGPHDTAIDPQGRPWQHRAVRLSHDELVDVEAGKFRAAHVRVESQRDGTTQLSRELWIVPGIGIVRDRYRDALGQVQRELRSFTPGRDDAEERLRAQLDRELANPRNPAWNNRPFVRWVDDVPEALLLPGRIAVVKTDRSTALYYVDHENVRRFDPQQPDSVAPAAMAAFGAETAIPPESTPLHSLALLLAHAVAASHDLGKVHEVTPTLQPLRAVPRDSHRQAIVEVQGGALDGSDRRVAVFLTLHRSTDIHVVTDLDPPSTAPTTR